MNDDMREGAGGDTPLSDTTTRKRRAALYLLAPGDAERAKALEAKLEDFARTSGYTQWTRFYERQEGFMARPRRKVLVTRAEAGAIDVVLVPAVGMLAPSRRGALRVAQTLDKLGVSVRSMAEPWWDLREPALAWIAEGEQRVLDRSVKAIQAKRQRGERVGEIPYGYRLASDGLTVEPEPNEQHVIAEAC